MTRWIFFLLPLLSAAVFAAVLLLKPPPPQAGIGVVDAGKLFSLDTDLITLEKVESAGLRAAPLRGETVMPGASEFRNTVLRSEWDTVRRELESKESRLISVWSESYSNDLEQEYLLLYGNRNEESNNAFADAEQQLKAVYRSVLSPQAWRDDSLRDERFKLFNLQLKLRVLTHDPIVLPDARLNTIQSEIKTIQDAISSAKTLRENRLNETYARESETVRETYRKSNEEKEKELEAKARRLLADTDALMDSLISGYRAEVVKRLEDSKIARKGVLKTTGVLADENSFQPDKLVFDMIKADMRAEFYRRLRRKAVSVAERKNLALILVTPYPPVGESTRRVVDVSGEF
jgi:hypothetical protein